MTYRVAAMLAVFGFSAIGDAAGPWKRHTIDDSSKGADGVRFMDVNRDGLPDIATGWEQGGQVRVYVHPGRKHVRERWPAATVGRVRDIEDAVFGDFDGDGRVDVVSCAEGQGRVVSMHWGPRDAGDHLKDDQWQTQPLPQSAGQQMWMFALPLQVDGAHGLDLVAGGKNKDAALGWFKTPADARKLDDWKWHKLRDVGWLMSLVAADMDSDGDEDVVFSDRKGSRSGAFWLENPGADQAESGPWKEHAIGGLGKQCMFLTLGDLDADGLVDVLLAVQPKELLWLRRNDKTGRSWTPHSIVAPEPTGIMKAVSVGDIDLDGRNDLVFSCEQARAPAHGLMWLSYEGKVTDGRWTAHELSGVDGVKHDLVPLVDLDGDGDLDVTTTEEVKNLGVIWYENPTR